MIAAIIIAVAIVWYAAGAASHIYWVTAKYDYKSDDVWTTILAAVLGPIVFLIGWSVYGPEREQSNRVLFRKRLS